ncbi:hypothetical protein ACHAQH_006772 [Verticillium albo-atrum]
MMILLKHLAVIAAVFAPSVIGQGSPDTATEAKAFWEQLDDMPNTLPTPSIKGRFPEAFPEAIPEFLMGTIELEERGKKHKLRDPYKNRQCPNYLHIDLPRQYECHRNNCYRGFLNARDGSYGRHCPAEAFNLCCLWLSANNYCKKWAIKSKDLYKRAPYARSCKDHYDSVRDVVRKIDDICACTVGHKVTVDNGSEYFKLRNKMAGTPICRKAEGPY